MSCATGPEPVPHLHCHPYYRRKDRKVLPPPPTPTDTHLDSVTLRQPPEQRQQACRDRSYSGGPSPKEEVSLQDDAPEFAAASSTLSRKGIGVSTAGHSFMLNKANAV